ncbi:hypothetical protein V6767_05920 [Martelella sp. FLE1502]
MDETAEVLLNPVMLRVTAYLVPWLAFERFAGRDEFEASYSKKPVREGADVIPFIETMARGVEGDWPVMDALGLHAASDQDVSSMYIEAYNAIINYRNKNVSLDLPERDRLDPSLAKAIRERGRHRNIVPSFDEAAMEGVVGIDVLNADAVPVVGIGPYQESGVGDFPIDANPSFNWRQSDGSIEHWDKFFTTDDSLLDRSFDIRADENGFPMVFAKMDGAEMQFSLASIDRAKKMRLFAQLRKRYSGLDDDAIIAKLMDGIRMPDQMFEQPIELGSRLAGFGFSKRFATDAVNLDQAAVSGAAMLSMQIATPRVNPGGVLMFVAEIQPEQIFERQADPFLTVTDVDQYPQFIRDDGDEQKVDLVKNWEIDTAHTDPDGLFGYTPLNHKWRIEGPRIGTGFFQSVPQTSFDEDRARIWDTSPADPALGEDWYLCSEIDKGVFAYSNREPFEASGMLELAISGNTVFGRELIEGADDYEKINERIPGREDQIEQEA